jgi:hypothetical protein
LWDGTTGAGLRTNPQPLFLAFLSFIAHLTSSPLALINLRSWLLISVMAPPTKLSANSRPRRAPPIIFAVLAVLLAWGSDALGGQGHRNGFIPHAEAHVKEPEIYKYLPGSRQPLLRYYTGIGGLDDWLVVLNVSFANITDGSVPAAALYAFQFGGQIVPILAFLILEWSRHGYGSVGRFLRK